VSAATGERLSAWRVPFNRATLTGDELERMREAVDNGHISGDGPFTRRCEELLEQAVGTPRALLTTSCTHALELAALLLDVEPGDEVVVPAFTFTSSATAFALRGARIVFADVREDTLNLDEAQVPALVTERTRAIVAVHYAGVGCELDALGATAERAGAALVEDNAHGLFGSYRGRPLGSFGLFAAQSFHETKNVTCGEGGALLVNDARYVERAEVIREKGTDRKKFFRGQVAKYTWVDIGSSYVLSDLNAAFLSAQLEARAEIQAKRERLWRRYDSELAAWAAAAGARLPYVPEDREQAYHMFYVLAPSLEARTALIEHLRERGILAVFHYLPLHLSDMGLRHGGRPGQCPVTEDLSDRLVRLPFYTGMTDEEQEQVLAAVTGFRGG
jgi:dTDP-4-amino-4,6-dideoxygalactose transaminase